MEPRRIAYYLWRYPALSETFIRRELSALVDSGLEPRVLADRSESLQGSIEIGDRPDLPVSYVRPLSAVRATLGIAARALAHPTVSRRTWSYLRRNRYAAESSLGEDLSVFFKVHYLASLLRAQQITHLHSPWGDMSAIVAMLAAPLAGATFSVQFRAHELHRRSAAFALAEKIRRAAFVVTNSGFNEELLREHAGDGQRAKIHRIYDGLDPTQFDAGPRERGPEEPVRILSVARLIEPKGLLNLLEACAQLGRQGLDYRCDLVGGPELPRYAADHEEILSAHRRLGLQDRVRLLGSRPFAFVKERYRWADIFALPCQVGSDGSQDITPNGLIEAMACGLPVVSTRLTAIPEIIEDGKCGLLAPPGDVPALVAALRRLMKDRALRVRLGQSGRSRVEQRFDIRRNAQEYLRLFLTGVQ